MKIGKNIKKIRNIKGFNQEEFGALFELSRATVGAYEEERALPKIETLLQIANYIGVTIDQLINTHLTVNQIHGFKGVDWVAPKQNTTPQIVHFKTSKDLVNKTVSATYKLPFFDTANLFSIPKSALFETDSQQPQAVIQIYRWINQKSIPNYDAFLKISDTSVFFHQKIENKSHEHNLYGKNKASKAENFNFAVFVGSIHLGTHGQSSNTLNHIEERLRRIENHLFEGS